MHNEFWIVKVHSFYTIFNIIYFQEALNQICEFSEAGITVRGTYFPKGKQPKEQEGEAAERKLYLAIEGTSEISIAKAKKEITRLIKEELIRLVSQTCSLQKFKRKFQNTL